MTGHVLIIAESAAADCEVAAERQVILGLGGAVATAVAHRGSGSAVSELGAASADLIAGQMRAAFADADIGVVKIGALSMPQTIDRVADLIQELAADLPVVVDPVILRADPLSPPEPLALAALKRRLALLATVLTPDLADAEALTGMAVRDPDAMQLAAQMLLTIGPRSVLLKGDGLFGMSVADVLATEAGCEVLASPDLTGTARGRAGRGLASAIAVGLAQDMPLAGAVRRARSFVYDGARAA